MEPLDTASEKFAKILDTDIPTYSDTLISEADIRMKRSPIESS